MFIKDRRAAPALGLRSLQPYVSAALRPERKRVRNGHICPVRHLSTAESFLIPAEKKASVRKRTKAISLVLTTCYIILGAVCRLLRIWRPLTRELTSALTLAVQYRSGAPSGLRLGSDIRQYPTDAGLAPSPGSLGCSDKTYCLRHSLCYWIYAHVII